MLLKPKSGGRKEENSSSKEDAWLSNGKGRSRKKESNREEGKE